MNRKLQEIKRLQAKRTRKRKKGNIIIKIILSIKLAQCNSSEDLTWHWWSPQHISQEG